MSAYPPPQQRPSLAPQRPGLPGQRSFLVAQRPALGYARPPIAQQRPARYAVTPAVTLRPIEEGIEDTGVQLEAVKTFVECFPQKVKTGCPHPHTIVETTSMNAVEPPDVRINLAIPEEWIDRGGLSVVQMEAVIYACQSHESVLPNGMRRGFLVGDGAGVGKGRTIAGVIIHNYQMGRKKAIWLSVSSDLRFDAERDLSDVAGPGYCPIYQLSKFKYGNIKDQNGTKGIMFATYASLIGKSRSGQSRLLQLIEWCGPNFDGVIVFDECHRAKNLCPKAGSSGSSLIGKCVVDLQNALPNARVVYASATGATEIRNMAYMVRLGIWGSGTPFATFWDFLGVVEKRGMGAMELLAMDLKRRGLYIARQLSFTGVDFDVVEVPLTADFKRMYDEAVIFWTELQSQFTRAFDILTRLNRKTNKSAWTHYYSACQRFFKHLCIAVKVPMCVRVAQQAIAQGKCVVIGLQSTGESQTNEVLEEADGDLDEFVSTPKQLLISLIEKYFPGGLDDFGQKFRNANGFGDREFREAERADRRKRRTRAFDLNVPDHARRPKRLKMSVEPSSHASDSSMDEEDENSDEGDPKKRRHSLSTNLSSDVGSTDGEEDEDDTSDEEDDGTPRNDNDDMLVAEMMNELGSSSEDSGDEEDSPSPRLKHSDTECSPRKDDLDESYGFNLFCMDYSKDPIRHDPWASRQQLIEDATPSPSEVTPSEITTVTAPILEQQRKRKKKKKVRTNKQTPAEPSKIREFAKQITETMKATAIESARTESRDSGYVCEYLSKDLTQLSEGEVDSALSWIKEELLERANKIGELLPINTLDALIDELGGPENVAEMTGRRGRVVRLSDGSTVYKKRNFGENVNLELINIQEKDHFMNGEKYVAIISEAASSGVSLHADRRVPNKRKRVHITLELPWSADKAVQQFGRTHRSNQEQPPEYLFLISELAGEKRFVSTASKRLQSLGALTHGDRRAVAESDDLSKFCIDNKYGKRALQIMLHSFITTKDFPFNLHPNFFNTKSFADAKVHMLRVGILREINGTTQVERETLHINKFLNRLMLMPVDIQNYTFDYYMRLISLVISRAKREGTFDNGTMDLGSNTDVVNRVETCVYVGQLGPNRFELQLHKIAIDRGFSWNDVKDFAAVHEKGAFVYSIHAKHKRRNPAFVFEITSNSGATITSIIRPNVGRTQKSVTMNQLLTTHRKFESLEAVKEEWDEMYKTTKTVCLHEYNFGNTQHDKCEVGRRVRSYYILSGAVLTAWKGIEAVLSRFRRNHYLQIVRINTTESKKIVGVLVPPAAVEALRQEITNSYSAIVSQTY